MSLLLEVVVVVVYGGSALIAAGSGVAWLVSHKFRRSLIGDHAAD
jgi:hypothetical protein